MRGAAGLAHGHADEDRGGADRRVDDEPQHGDGHRDELEVAADVGCDLAARDDRALEVGLAAADDGDAAGYADGVALGAGTHAHAGFGAHEMGLKKIQKSVGFY